MCRWRAYDTETFNEEKTMAWGQDYHTGTPADHSETPSIGHRRMREAKEATRERLDVDHYFPANSPTAGLVNHADTGEHRHVTLRERAAPATVDQDKAVLFARESGGKSALAVMDEDEKDKTITRHDTDNDVHVLNLEGKDFTAATATVTDGSTITVVAGKLTLRSGDTDKGIQAGHLNTDAGGFCDGDSLEIDGSNGLQVRPAWIAGRLGQAAQAVGSTDISSSSSDWADMAGMELAVTPAGGDVMIRFSAGVRNGDNSIAEYRITIDGTPVLVSLSGQGRSAVSMHWLASGLSETEHVFKVQWRRSQGIVYQDGATFKRVLQVEELPS